MLRTESANETTLADCFNVTAGEEQFLCVGSNLLLIKGDLFFFVLILVSFVKGDSTNRLLLLTPAAPPDSSCCCCFYLPLSSQIIKVIGKRSDDNNNNSVVLIDNKNKMVAGKWQSLWKSGINPFFPTGFV
jgi:hypothetical protein